LARYKAKKQKEAKNQEKRKIAYEVLIVSQDKGHIHDADSENDNAVSNGKVPKKSPIKYLRKSAQHKWSQIKQKKRPAKAH